MASNGSKLPLATIAGGLVIILFCIFTLASAARYPGPFSPMDNWLSDLGAVAKNPLGYMYFDMGCIVTGVCLLLLMAGMDAWRSEDNREKLLLAAGRACGTASAFALMLIGVFDEGTPYHAFLAIAFFMLLFLLLAITNISIWKHPAYNRWIGYYAVAVIVIDLAFMYTFYAYEHAPAWEWLAVFSGLLWVALLAFNTIKLESA